MVVILNKFEKRKSYKLNCSFKHIQILTVINFMDININFVALLSEKANFT